MQIDSGLLSTFIRDIAIPEIMAVVRAHHNAGLPPPTNDQIISATELGAERYISVGEAFLQSLPPSPMPAVPAVPAAQPVLEPAAHPTLG